MAQPRFRQYTGVSSDARKIDKSAVARGIRRGFITILVLAIIAIGSYAAVQKVPVKSSLDGAYTPPASRDRIVNFSRSRWFLQNAHEDQMAVNLAWYHSTTLDIPTSVGKLDRNGFRPFLFIDEKDKELPILDISVDPASNPAPFLIAISRPSGTSAGFISRKTDMSTNILGDTWNDFTEKRILINSDSDTSIHGQFLPENPELPEQYVSYLAQVWETAAASYIALYQRPPDNLDDLLDGIGLRPNPACVWPFEEHQRINAACEGGLIEGKIIYWTVTMPGGDTRGQARYWDQYTSYDDAGTPDSIITREVTSPVVDPRFVPGSREVMFNLNIMKNLLDEAHATIVETEQAE